MDYSKYTEIIDNSLYNCFGVSDNYQKKIYGSMKYSLSSGGKRVRPVLTILSYQLFRDDIEVVLPFANAIEFIHTYSLIHDDLPAMDDDDIRRGKPTNHKVYSEAIAILAGDGLLNLAAEVISKELESYNAFDMLKRGLKAMRYTFNASGTQGMIGGQVIDIEYTVENSNRDIMETMYNLKTSALIRAAIVSGAIMGGADEKEITILEEFSNKLGLAYQIKDDYLDLETDGEDEKNTIISFLEVEDINSYVEFLTNKALEILRSLERDTSDLEELALSLVNRSR